MLGVFDVNETLLDLRPLDRVFGSPAARAEWFRLLIHSALTVTATGGYRSFGALALEAAAEHADRAGRAFTEDQRTELVVAMRALPAHPDVPAGLEILRQAGFRLVALANSPLATVRAQLDHAGLAFDAVYSAEQASALKPAPAAYRQVLAAEDVEPDAAVLVAAHGWDIAGAKAAGLRTAFLGRPGQRQLPQAVADWSAPDLPALAEALISALPSRTRHAGASTR